VPEHAFTDEELAEVSDRVAETPQWLAWERRRRDQGGDVVTITVDGRRPMYVTVSKAGPGSYVATGFDSWGLTVSESLDGLLAALATIGREPTFARA